MRRPGTEPLRIIAWAAIAAVTCLAAACGRGEPRVPCDAASGLPTLCGVRNPEDLALAERLGLVVVSNMRWDGDEPAGGYLSAVLPDSRTLIRLWPRADRADAADPDATLGDPACSGPPDPEAYYPHGLAVEEQEQRTLVYVVTHRGELGGREAVDIFELVGSGDGAALVWKACVATPGAIQANDVAALGDGSLVASNYQPDASLQHTVRAGLLGATTGNVILWRPGKGWSGIANTEAAMANGVAIGPDRSTLFYTETITGKLYRLRLDATGGKIAVDIGGNPDNLSWTSRKTLLVATHTDGSAFMFCLLGRRPCKTGWAVYEVDPVTLTTSLVLDHDGTNIGAVTTALEANGRIYLGGVYEDRIGAIPVEQ